VIAGSIESVTAEIRRQRPAVVINTIGPFTTTAVPIVRACLPESYYIDLASEVAATLGLNGAAAGADGRKVLATASQAVSFEGLARGQTAQAAIRFRKQSPRSPQHLAVQGGIRI